jgi:phosphatidylserine/phosphatidylglycerophosphate/cardiolipin synthase-like enzyme
MAKEWLKVFPDAKRTKADFLIDGEQAFESIIRAIETATAENPQDNFIYILGWMLDIDLQLVKSDKDKTLFKLLKEADGKGVEIRILIWDNLLPNYAKLNYDAVARLNRLPNTKVFIDEHTFFPQKSKQLIQKIAPHIVDLIRRYGHLLFSAQLEENYNIPPAYILSRLLFLINQQTIGAHHEKVVVVKAKGKEDKLVAFCGGIDFNKNRVISKIKNQEHRFPYYHDTACRLEGPAAWEVLERFKRRWHNHPTAKNEILRGEKEGKPPEKPAPYPYAQVVGTYNSLDGREKDRSLSKAYLQIIDNAKSYIYIEDQYLVNLDVARALNKKIKDPKFRKLTFAIQDSIETSDILIPNRKRGEFYEAVLKDSNDDQKSKVLLAVIDRTNWEKEHFHPGMHAKTLIVDDEIAIIGSANVNQRSFTCDSETSVIVFDDSAKVDQNFARIFRIATWKDFLRKPIPSIVYESWWNFPNDISQGPNGFSILIKYAKDLQDDLDLRIIDLIKSSSVIGMAVAFHLSGHNLTVASAALSPHTIVYIFDTLWEHFIDPNAD